MSRSSRRRKYIDRSKKNEAQKKSRAKCVFIIACVLVILIVAAVAVGYISSQNKRADDIELFDRKSALLKEQVLSDARASELSGEIEDGLPDSVVFISICNGDERAKVFTGTGADKETAWNDAYSQARAFVEENSYNCLWVKADLVGEAKTLNTEELSTELHHFRPEFFRKGISFDKEFNTALLESELNGAKILDYDKECVN